MSDFMSRRTFVKAVTASAVVTSIAKNAPAEERTATAGTPTEWSWTSGKQYDDPFNQVDVDAVITLPSGGEERVPGFWAGGSTWRVRYAPPAPGSYKVRSVCTDAKNRDLHDQQLTLHVEPYAGSNPHYKHGPLKIAADGRHFQHADGTPFFWLGDTWWMGLCKRLSWPDGFETLTADRVRKGFTMVQIVAGLYPDMEPFDERGANEAGYPWERDFARINPAYFDTADVRIQHLADHGLAACIVGFWGYFIPLHGHGQGEKALALPGRALERLSRRVVPGRRGNHALLPLQNQGAGRGNAEAWTDRAGPLRARHRSASSSHHHPSLERGARMRRRSLGDRLRHAADRPQRPRQRAQHHRDHQSRTRRHPAHAGPHRRSLLRGNPGSQPAGSAAIHVLVGDAQRRRRATPTAPTASGR